MLQAKDIDAVTPEHRELCLNAIFRANNTGLVDSDAVPTHIINMKSNE